MAGEHGHLWCRQCVHPNPIFYKHFFQVFSTGSLWEGSAFFEHAPRLNIAEFDALIRKYRDAGTPCLIYAFRQPRLGNTPFDRTSARWANVIFAPAWEDDTDLVLDGHK